MGGEGLKIGPVFFFFSNKGSAKFISECDDSYSSFSSVIEIWLYTFLIDHQVIIYFSPLQYFFIFFNILSYYPIGSLYTFFTSASSLAPGTLNDSLLENQQMHLKLQLHQPVLQTVQALLSVKTLWNVQAL